MPFYDRRCTVCAWQTIDVIEPVSVGDVSCPKCHEPTERFWSKAPNVIGDECDFISRNGEKEPRRFRSKIEHRRWLKEKGLRVFDRHVGAPGGDSDKSKHTMNWGAVSQSTLDEAKTLLERVGQSTGWRDPAKAPIGITSEEGLIRYMGDLRAAENGNTFGFKDR